MKKLFLIAVLIAAVMQQGQGQVTFTALTLANKYPQQNQKIAFVYNKKFSPLIKEKGVELAVYQFTDKGVVVDEPMLTQKANLYSGSFTAAPNANAILFGFSYNEVKDNNGKAGYVVPLYGADQKILPGYYAAAAAIYNGNGEYYTGLAANEEKAFELLNEGISSYPTLKQNTGFMNSYLSAILSQKNPDANTVVTAELETFEKRDGLKESDYNFLSNWYGRLKNKEKAEQLTAAMKAAYPNGDWLKADAVKAIAKEKDLAKKEELLNAFLQKYPSTADNEAQQLGLKYQMVNAFAGAKNYQAFSKWVAQLKPAMQAQAKNSLAWKLAEKGEELELAKKLSKEATEYSRQQWKKPTEPRPQSYTTKAWKQGLESTYASHGDTYAFVLYQLGEYANGFPIAKEAATLNKLKDADFNERYALFAQKILPVAQSKKLIQSFVEEGTANTKIKEALKELYMKEKGSDAGYDAYLSNLEQAANNKKRAEIAKEMINENAPAFTLKDFDGNQVSLASLKGKVVVVDFWATWCGPCIASMPAMLQAQNKFKDNPNVKFLFVDTWENVDDKLKNAKDFMTQKNYPFHVLMDDKDEVVTAFGVRGIPAKFVIDADGNIRFKSVGFSGNDDALVFELSSMIELATN